MPDDPRVDDLLERLLESGSTPEEVCLASPELLPRVRARWRRLRAIEDEIGALFPGSIPSADMILPAPRGGELPQIRGYEVQAVLGRGGMGVVYKARHLRLNRAVALKMLVVGAYARPRELERFLQEAEAVAGLRHPNIVQVHDVGDLDGRPYFTMEYVEAGSLDQKIAGTPQPAGEAAALVATLAEAIHAAHQGGIIHRDLKPANILLTADGTPKITDFGLARRLEGGGELTQSGTPLGTPGYMAPEQAEGRTHAIGPATDVYALGAILYELLTGRPPFRSDTAIETERQVIAQDPVPPSRLNSHVPRDLETICLKCLQKEPSRRYAGALALAEDLQRFGRGEPIAARPVGSVERGVRWLRRRPALATALVACALFAASLTALALRWHGQRSAAVRAAVEAAEDELYEAAGMRQRYDFAGAAAMLQRARLRLGDDGPAELQRRLAQASHDPRPGAAAGCNPPAPRDRAVGGQSADHRPTARGWAAGRPGVRGDIPRRRPGHDAGRPRVGGVPRRGLAGPLGVDRRPRRLGELRRRSRPARLDPGRGAAGRPGPVRDRIRDPRTWNSPAAVARLTAAAPVADQPPQLLATLARRLWESGHDDPAFIRSVVLAHPGDCWANVELAYLSYMKNPVEGLGYYRTALAIRPETPEVHGGIGVLYLRHGQISEARHHSREAADRAPSAAWVRNNLGMVALAEGHPDEAASHLRAALRLDPDYASAHGNLALVLEADGRPAEALAEAREALRLDPKDMVTKPDLQGLLLRLDCGDEWRRAWQQELAAEPPDHDAWFGYAELCVFLRREAEYRRIRRIMLRVFGSTTNSYVAMRIGRACLLLPGSDDESRQAVALVDRGVAAKASISTWIFHRFLFSKAMAEYRLGRFDAAIALLEGEAASASSCTRLLVAMAQHRSGQTDRAQDPGGGRPRLRL